MQIVTYVRFCQIKIFCASAVSNCLGGRGFVYRDDLTISSVAIRYRYYRRRASKLTTDWTEFDDITVAHGDSNFLRAAMFGLWVGSLSANWKKEWGKTRNNLHFYFLTRRTKCFLLDCLDRIIRQWSRMWTTILMVVRFDKLLP